MRHADIGLTYQGKNITSFIANDLTKFEYDEVSDGDSDSLSIELNNKSRKWMNAWFPSPGDRINGLLVTHDWNYPGEIRFLDCGEMVVDEPEFTGPPDLFVLKALSIPADAGWNSTENSRTWAKISVKQLGKYFADKYHLKYTYDVPRDFVINSLKQSDQTDADFLKSTAEKYNIYMKVFSSRLVLYDKAVYEARPPVASYTLGESNIINYSLYAPTVGTGYSAAVENYTLNSKNYKYTFRAKSGGKVLILNESVDDVAQAEMVAKAKLREKNESDMHGSLTLSLDLRLFAACTIVLAGFGKVNGKYFVDSCNHDSGAGETTIDIHKCLSGGY